MKTFSCALAALFLLVSCENPIPTPSPGEEEAAKRVGNVASAALMQSLGGQLKAALESGGPETALAICRDVAMPSTIAVAATVEQGGIRRTTLQPRNPKNAPDATDREVLALLADADPLPTEHLVWGGEKVRFYKPLVMQQLCLQCHGDPSGFSEGLQAKLAQLYPEDQAVGYELGDLRGAICVDLDRRALGGEG